MGAVVAAASATAQGVSTDGLVLPKGVAGAWDEAAVGAPIVRCYMGDDEQRWFMWYSGRAVGAPALDAVVQSSGTVGVAVSSDGVNWRRSADRVTGMSGAVADVGASFEPNAGDWWSFDTCHVAPADVSILSNSSVGSGWGGVAAAAGGNGGGGSTAVPPGVVAAAEAAAVTAGAAAVAAGAAAVAAGLSLEGLRMRPGLAMSQDGRNWARIEGDHHTGALFDVGAAGEWDQLFIGGPQVLACGPKDMRLWYHSWDTSLGRYVIGMATSPDGFRWTKKGVVFDPVKAAAGSGSAPVHDVLGASAHYIVKDMDTRQYLMFYEAVAADGGRSIGLAVSKDGLSGWKRHDKPVLQPTAEETGSWDSGSMGAPCVVSMSAGRWRLYYGGRAGRETGPWDGIGLALNVEGGESFEGVSAQFKRRSGEGRIEQAIV
ncbi:MAG: hypothetical protein WDW36_009139 [Sanguina aurantia]